jgi:molybdenum cofactor cytidylyltransferase
MESPMPDQVILMLCDQPYADDHLLKQMIEAQHSTGKPIVACAYKNTLGAPVLLDQKFYTDLLKLKGREGAKKLLFQNPNEVAEIPFPLGHIDIDTPDDLEALKKRDI